jgi:hypothetical protein
MPGVYNLKSGVADDTDIVRKLVVASADGAITIQNSTVVITKGSAIALTLGTPTTAQNGTTITIVASTAHSHTVTAATIGFNAANAGGDVATFGGAIGDGITVLAYGGEWLVLTNVSDNVTFG